ncbi:phage baseplate upper protein [Staphylococcus epidermidis]|uniref:phage baseplate upper protein n=1 Tax=Staphylococcus epidermidis TaxID=1282 RepID=UPI002096317B|nr:phage baseplate upper protein [Staphylococcus epidermidis]MCO6204573.1 phage baseplate upper protein [Staphylococcus epidermidis]
MIIKMTDVETHINPRNVNIGDIGSRFYTEDENTAFIRIRINYNDSPVDLTKTDMKPKLDLFMEDGSVFIDETIEVLIPESGLIQYDIPSNVIKHIGKVNCKLFMDSPEHSIHVANFSFGIVDSGVEKAVTKEINLNLVKDTVKQIMSEDLVNLLNDGFKDKLTDDLESYISLHSEEFKGEKGEPFKYEDFTQEQLNQLKAKGTDTGWQTLLLVNGVTQAGSSNKPMYKLITINDTEMLFIKGAVSSINNKEMNFAKLPENISGKIKDYKQYTKASINSYGSIVYNITIARSGDLEITIDPKNEVKSYDIYYIEEIVAL